MVGWSCLGAGTGHTGAMVGSRTLVVPALGAMRAGAQCTITLVQCAHHGGTTRSAGLARHQGGAPGQHVQAGPHTSW